MGNKLKTAEELGLSEAQYCGLVKTLYALEHDKLPHSFRMDVWRCGSACCIGGSAEVLGLCSFGADHEKLTRSNPALFNLFYPWVANRDRMAWTMYATPEQGARALRNYLTTGHPNWEDARNAATETT